MIDQTKRIVIDLPSVNTNEKDLKPLFVQLEKLIPDNALRRFKSAKICGQFYDGKDRPALLVGEDVKAQLEYIKAGVDAKITTQTDLKTLYVVSASDKPVQAVIVLQF